MKAGDLVTCKLLSSRFGIIIKRQPHLPEHWYIQWTDTDEFRIIEVWGEQDLEVISEGR